MKTIYTKIRNYLRRETDYCDYLRIEHPKEFHNNCYLPKYHYTLLNSWETR